MALSAGSIAAKGPLLTLWWRRWGLLPRDTRDTLFLLFVIAWTVLPHLTHLPLWCSMLTAAVLLLVLVAGLTWLVTRQVVTPVRLAREVAERLAARRKAHEDGAWVREATAAYAAKSQARAA